MSILDEQYKLLEISRLNLHYLLLPNEAPSEVAMTFAGLVQPAATLLALLLAFDVGRLDVAKALLAAEADPNAQSSDGDNPLMVAAREGNLDAIECLISHGADVNAFDNRGKASLHYAANWGHASVIELLERSGPNLEAVDNEGWTPLHDAATNGQAAVDNDGRTPLHCAAASRYAEVDAIGAFRFNVAAFEAKLITVDNNGHTPYQVYECWSCVSSDNANDSKIRALLTP